MAKQTPKFADWMTLNDWIKKQSNKSSLEHSIIISFLKINPEFYEQRDIWDNNIKNDFFYKKPLEPKIWANVIHKMTQTQLKDCFEQDVGIAYFKKTNKPKPNMSFNLAKLSEFHDSFISTMTSIYQETNLEPEKIIKLLFQEHNNPYLIVEVFEHILNLEIERNSKTFIPTIKKVIEAFEDINHPEIKDYTAFFTMKEMLDSYKEKIATIEQKQELNQSFPEAKEATKIKM